MQIDPLFLLSAGLAIASPGPGVLMTLNNALRHNLRTTSAGIIGLASGSLLIAGLCAGGLSLFLITTPGAFHSLQVIGALYLIVQGWRTFGRRPQARAAHDAPLSPPPCQPGSPRPWLGSFTYGASLQLSNPIVIMFYLSVFPQFVDRQHPTQTQFFALALIYAGLIVLIHGLYVLGVQPLRRWLTQPTALRRLNQATGLLFMLFGLRMVGVNGL